MAQSSVTLEGVVKTFGGVEVIKGVSLEVDPGELVVFVGPSGCGKSTLLRLIAGLEAADKGAIRIGARDVTHVHPSKRGIAMVFQSYALYPHMTVRENMAFGLKIRGMTRAEADVRVKRAADILQLDHLLDRKPRALSGGQRQRAAIGRAIVREPDVFLFDEPLSNLDAALRGQMRVELARLHAQLGTTMIYVTHDQVEAMTLANKIVVLNAGRIEQVGAPLELYHRPANVFVAGFIGSPKMNFLAGKVAERAGDAVSVSAAGVTVSLPIAAGLKPDDAVTLGVRPEDFRLSDGASGALAGSVALLEPLGSETIAHIALDSDNTAPLVVKLPGDARLNTGDVVHLTIDAARAHLFDAEGRTLKARGG